jgi:parvulin-like peptidyl-prolyl isomerase
MRFTRFAVSAVVLAFSIAKCAFAADNPMVIDQVVAKVNGDIVSQDELERLQKELAAELKQQGATGTTFNREYEDHSKDILRNRIDELLLIQKGKELNINIDSDVTKYMANLQRQSGLTDPEKFHEWIRQQSGRTFEDFQSETKDNYLTREVIGQEVGRHINITDKEIEDYYNAHKNDFIREEKVYLSEILISTEGKDSAGVAAAEKKAKQLADEAAKGERFSELARNNSDATTAKDGGVVGSYKKDELQKIFVDAVWNLPKGAVTQPIKIPTGWEIFKIDDHTKAGLEPLAEAKPEIENILYGPKMEPKIRDFLTQLRKTAFLQIKPGYTDTGAAPGMDTRWQDPATLKPETVSKTEVEQKTRLKRLLWVLPIPGTQVGVAGTSSSR